MESISGNLIELTYKLMEYCDHYKKKIIKNNEKVEFVYNPLNYAWEPHKKYLEDYGSSGAKIIIMGMNPGHGMGNTGIPFGCPKKVKNYLGITNLEVREPVKIHPKRRITGLDCEKSEISGERIWGLIEEIYGKPDNAFRNIFVMNHFPLWMFNSKGQNITPDKLSKKSTVKIFRTCNKYLTDMVDILNAKMVIGVGKYANKMANEAIKENGLRGVLVREIPHPSPANPLANKDKGAVWRRMSKNIIMGK